jgi:hypothetical protein
MLSRFHNDDAAYEQWLAAHPTGYVFNDFPGRDASMKLFHRATCPTLVRMDDRGRRTVVQKICTTTFTEMLEEVNRQYGERGWKQCGVCGG